MALRFEGGTGSAPGGVAGRVEVIEAQGRDEIVVPGRDFIVHATYSRVGHDLVLAADGREVVVRGFFDTDHPPSLASGEGAVIPGALASHLAGPIAPGQLAQAGPASATGAAPIGHVQSLAGHVTARHADGTTTTLAQGAPVFQGDVLQTGADGKVGIVFVDKTTFALGDNARMVLDEMIFDPNTHSGTATFSLLQGVFVAVTGEIGKANHDAVHINTPVASIGIRGTEFACNISNQGGEFDLHPDLGRDLGDDDGRRGSFEHAGPVDDLDRDGQHAGAALHPAADPAAEPVRRGAGPVAAARAVQREPGPFRAAATAAGRSGRRPRTGSGRRPERQ